MPVRIADFCYLHNIEPIFIDNNSDYKPLLDYYEKTPYQVVRLKANYGHTVIWQVPILEQLGIKGRYILTDPDLDLSNVKSDFLEVMNRGLDKYPNVDKCGLSLEINDLPDTEEGNFIRFHEAKYWKKPLDDMYFDAATDTTFALYREGTNHYSHSAIRTNRPYTARHIPWYYTDIKLLDEEEQNYWRTAATEYSSGKKRLVK